MPKTKYEKFGDAVDIIAISNGDSRLTREQLAGFKVSKETTKDASGNKRPNFKPPTDDQVQWAKQELRTNWLSFLTVKKEVTGAYPKKQPEETFKDFFKRLDNEYMTNENLWKTGLLSGAAFKPAPWIAGSLALDHGRKIGPGDLPAYNLPNADQVHIEAWVQFKNEPKPKRYVIYPKVIRRSDGRLEIGETGRLASETVTNAGWLPYDGWVTIRTPRRAILPPANEEDPGGAPPLPGLA